MTWFKVDDGFWSHPKTLQLTPSAVALWVRAGAWSCQHLTDGFVPGYALNLFGIDETFAVELVEVGYWDEVVGGYEFHDWEDYQESSGKVKERRAKNAEKLRKWREKQARNDSSNPVTDGVTNPVSNPAPDPTRPDPTSSSTKKRERATRGSRLDPDWLPTAADVAKIKSECPNIDPQREHAAFVDYWVAVPGQKGLKLDWSATWRNWMRRKQGDAKGGRVSPTERAQRTVMLATELQEIER